ncbi:hypothetical protein pb186bvf_007513 [Paramecium bursaria]
MNKNLELINRVYYKRKDILLMNCPNNVLSCFKLAQLFRKIEKKIITVSQYEFSIQEFHAYLIVQLTRSMEAYSLNGYSMRRFENDYERQALLSFRWRILSIKQEFSELISPKLQLYPFIKNDAYVEAIKNLKINKQLISIIVMQDLTDLQIDKYVNEVQIITISNLIGSDLIALSTYDGKFIYIINDSYVYNNHKYIEQALVDGFFYFWLIKNNNPFLIMGELNPILLQESNNRQQEAGDFYLSQIYGEKIKNSMPFRMIKLNVV